MKKILSVLACILLVISLSCCGKVTGEPVAVFQYTDTRFTQDFKDSSGNVVSSLDMTYPTVTVNGSPEAQQNIYNYFEHFKNEKISELEKNTDNLSKFKKRFDIDDVTLTVITYEYYYADNLTASFILTQRQGTDPGKSEPDYKALTFSLADGKLLSLSDLYADGADYHDEEIKSKIRVRANENYSENGAALSEDQVEKLDALFDERNFVCTNDRIIFIYSLSALSSGSRHGIYYCDLDFGNIEDILITPLTYYETHSHN